MATALFSIATRLVIQRNFAIMLVPQRSKWSTEKIE
jgi:hypothetical protein